MDNENVIMVGGPADGRTFRVNQKMQVLNFPISDPARATYADNFPFPDGSAKQLHVYRRKENTTEFIYEGIKTNG